MYQSYSLLQLLLKLYYTAY